jgi:hypothetical protein
MTGNKRANAPSEPQPSTYMDDFWLWVERQKGEYPESTERCGKWLLFVPVEEVDAKWATIKRATEDGLLGDSAKVATAVPNPRARPGYRVICVYTYDGDDEQDIWRVREALRDLSFTDKLYWKADQATLAGQYSGKGRKGVSRYQG